MSFKIKPELADYLGGANYAWLTTVRADGMPQPTPVWFIAEGDTFLVYSMPDAQKIRNIRQNPMVALSYSDDPEAGKYVVIMGEAVIDQSVPPAHQNPAYLAKYTDGIKGLNWTPEQMGGMFSTAIRITPVKARGE